MCIESSGSESRRSIWDCISIASKLLAHTTFGENKYTNLTAITNAFAYMNTGAGNNGGEITVYNPFDSGSYTFFAGQGSSMFYQLGSGSYVTPTKSIAVHKVAQSNSGLQILISDITTMDISVYGVKG